MPETGYADCRKPLFTEKQKASIAAQADAGSNMTDGEVIRDPIRGEREKRAVEIESIRQALIAGERSGKPELFDFAAFKRRKAAQLG